MLPDFLPAAEVLAKGVKHVACYVADAITERRNGFSDDEAGDYLACAGADALAETFPTSAVNPHTADDPAAGSSPLPAAGSLTCKHCYEAIELWTGDGPLGRVSVWLHTLGNGQTRVACRLTYASPKDAAVKTGLDHGSRWAAETFPQHTKPTQ